VPDCIIKPLSKTIILSAFLTEDVLWLITMVVFPLDAFFKLFSITSSVSVSTAERQSSKINIFGFEIKALAIETLCF